MQLPFFVYFHTYRVHFDNPAKVVRALTEDEIKNNYENAKHYAEKRELYR